MPHKRGKVTRRDAKRDQSEPEIIKALEEAGAIVFRLDTPFDLLVAWQGRWLVLECKTGKESLNKNQWADIHLIGDRATVHIVRTPEQASRALNGE